MAEALAEIANGDGAIDGVARMVGQIERGIEDRVQAIAHNFLDHAAVLDHDVGEAVEVAVEQANERARVHPLGHGREALDVREQRGDLAHLALEPQKLGLRDQPAHDLGCQMLLEPPAHGRLASLAALPPSRTPPT